VTWESREKKKKERGKKTGVFVASGKSCSFPPAKQKTVPRNGKRPAFLWFYEKERGGGKSGIAMEVAEVRPLQGAGRKGRGIEKAKNAHAKGREEMTKTSGTSY